MIIISPAKTMNKIELCNEVQFLFPKKSKALLKEVLTYDKEQLGTLMKIKAKTLDNTYDYYQNFKYGAKAIDLYNGEVFKQVNCENETYLKEHVYILSAFYGIVNASSSIAPYRLDYTMSKLFDTNLYTYWKDEVNLYINQQTSGQILNLASNEFTKLIDKNTQAERFIDLEFTEKKNSAILKKVRGRILNQCISEQISNYTSLVGFEDDIFKIEACNSNKLLISFK